MTQQSGIRGILTIYRTEEKFKALFKEAGMKILRTEIQKGFPKELYAVRMWALKPKISPAPAAKKPESSSYNNSNENR